MDSGQEPSLVKTVRRTTVSDTGDLRRDLDYWLAQSPEQRLGAVDFLREQEHGNSIGLQRVARVVQRPRS